MLIRAAEYARLTPPSRKQTFLIRGICGIENTQSQETAFSVVIPIPQQTQSQIYSTSIEWTYPEIEMHHRQAQGNSFALWRGNLRAAEKKICEYRVRVISAPITSVKAETNEITQPSSTSASISVSDPRIQAIVQKLSRDNPCTKRFIRCAYEYVLSHLVYGKPIEGLYTFDDALTQREVDCGGFSALLVSVLLTYGIPARITSGFLAPCRGKNSMHVWAEALLKEGMWIPLDPSIDYLFRSGRASWRSGRFGFVGSDHLIFSHGCDVELMLDKQLTRTPLLQHPFFVFPQIGLSLWSRTEITKA